MEWLLESDPSIRWQVMRDLLDSPFEEERAKVAHEGLGAQLLALQDPGGTWAGAAWNRGWNSTMHVLTLLRLFGLDPASAQARTALGRVRDHVTWKGCGPPEIHHHRFFEGETEPCINGQVAAAGAYFGEDVHGLIQRLLSEQLADGGWNCAAEDGSMRGSFNTTICVLDALLEFEKAGGSGATAARLRGQEYLLERGLMRRKSTGETIEKDRKGGASWADFAFPNWWHYDVLRGLDYLRDAGVTPDARMAEAIDLVRKKGDPWKADAHYPGALPVDLDEDRWITLRARRVLRWAGEPE